MISIVEPIRSGNALRLFIEPVAGALLWKVLRKGSDSFSGHDDASALVVYEGDEKVFVDSQSLKNDVMAFYRPFYSLDGGTSWVAGPTGSGTPSASYLETSTDVLGFLRQRLEEGLLVEVQRGNFQMDLGYIQVYVATPSLEQNLAFPLVSVHLEEEADSVRAIGEDIGGDFLTDGGDWTDAEGWIASVKCVVIGWAMNGDERMELRKAIRRVLIANLPVFHDKGWEQISLSQSDIDAVSGEYPAPMFQVMNNFSCLAPVTVSSEVSPVNEIITRSTPYE